MVSTSDRSSGGDDVIDLANLTRDVLSRRSSATDTTDYSTTSDRPFVCFCGKSFQQSDSLKKHKINHFSDEGKKCRFKNCGRVFTYDSDRSRHEETHYRKLGLLAFQKLLEHSETHKKNLVFVCNHPGCGKRFAHHGFFENHVKSHAPDRPHYPCSHSGCGKVFLTQRGLFDHEQAHSSETEPYRCTASGCGKVFKFQSHLVRHEKTHIPPSKRSKHTCFFKRCNKTFTRSDALVAHLKRHETSERPFPCDIEGCVRSFYTRYDLKRHIKVMHGT
ncbi:unnamed protein product [Dicrocoelium dendriticum]|nr:unnamed protein product [Dicrocoelium dendriticum]